MAAAPARILFLAPQPFHSLRGTCMANLQVLKALSAMGLRVDVLTFPGGSDPCIPGVRVLRLPSLPGLGWAPIGFSWRKLALDGLMALALPPLLARGRYGVVHASEDGVLLGALLKPLFRFRLVYDMDDVLSQRLEQAGVLRARWALRLARAVERWALRSADLVVANGASTARYAAGAAGEGRVLAYDHVPFDEGWTEPAPEPAADGGATILYAGNAEPYQGVELLIESLPFVRERLPEARCVIVGGEEEQIERQRRLAQRRGVAGMLRWLGKRPFAETFALMRRADVLVSPMTQAKAVPMKLYAYAAAGRPIVATDLPNNTELLSPESALLVDARPERLAEGIVRVLRDRPLSRRLSDGARALARRCIERSALSCLRAGYAPLASR